MENRQKLEQFIRNMPKVELHCHIDGSLRPETIIDIAQKEGIAIKNFNKKNYLEIFSVKGNCKSLKEYLNKFYYCIEVMQKKEYIYRVVLELLEDCKKDGVIYEEMRFAPLQHLDKGLTTCEAVEAALEAMKKAEELYHIKSGLILCCMRHESIENSLKVIELARQYRDKGVVGVDLAGNESDFPPELHKKAFEVAYEFGVNITIHAAETGIFENIIKSIELLHANRIGHGVFAYKDGAVMDYLVRKSIPLELCSTSNINTGVVKSYREHPLPLFYKYGIKTTINTDNRTVSNVTLTDEYINMLVNTKLTVKDIVKISENGIEASFLEKDQKTVFINDLHRYVDENYSVISMYR